MRKLIFSLGTLVAILATMVLGFAGTKSSIQQKDNSRIQALADSIMSWNHFVADTLVPRNSDVIVGWDSTKVPPKPIYLNIGDWLKIGIKATPWGLADSLLYGSLRPTSRVVEQGSILVAKVDPKDDGGLPWSAIITVVTVGRSSRNSATYYISFRASLPRSEPACDFR